MSIAFRGDEVKFVRFTELNGDGTTNIIDGNTLIDCCIESISWDNDIRESESVEIPSANSDCDIRYRRKAKKFGGNLTISVRKNYPELENILLGSPLNLAGTDVVGEQDVDFECKFISVELGISPIGGDCEAQELQLQTAWRLFPQVGYWAKTEAEEYSSGREVPTVTFTGYYETNPNFDDPYGIWGTNWSAGAFSSKAKLNAVYPACPVEQTTSDLVLTNTLV